MQTPKDGPYIVNHVITRTGVKEPLNIIEIINRINNIISRSPVIENVDPQYLVTQVVKNIKDLMHTSEIDEYVAAVAASTSIKNPSYMQLASRLAVDNHQKNTDHSFIDKMKKAYLRVDVKGKVSPMLSRDFYKYVEEHKEAIENIINYSHDFLCSYFGLLTFLVTYSLKIGRTNIERPQDMYMRTAIDIHRNTLFKYVTTNKVNYELVHDKERELNLIRDVYIAMATKKITHATPTYTNAGTLHPQ